MGSEDFDQFVRREAPALVAFVRRVANVCAAQAQDAVQDAIIKAYENWAEIDHPRAWIRQVAQRAARAEAARSQDGMVRAVAGGHLVTVHHDPDIAVLHSEHDQLLRYLTDLPTKQRLVMAWHLDGFDNEEIAEQLSMAPATVRSNLRHARTALSTRLQQSTD
jgi:RNA polymerase sigma-70 factor (ECF subfamily)